jgi:hypothetical protein
MSSRWLFRACQEPIRRLLNLQLQRHRCSRLEGFKVGEIIYIVKSRYEISCVVDFYILPDIYDKN